MTAARAIARVLGGALLYGAALVQGYLVIWVTFG